jgi:hypothetical protein
MHRTPLTPVLIIGFNRPRTLANLLDKVENLEPREVWISIDGPRSPEDYSKVSETIRIVNGWSSQTRHSTKIVAQVSNLGIYTHALDAMSEFFKTHEIGLILEDDIEFHPNFIKFVDQNQMALTSGKYWSICGHNPISDLASLTQEERIKFYPTHIHTIWGWAASKKSVLQFINLAQNSTSINFESAISKAAKKITSDPFLRLGIRRVWERKMTRALKSDSGGGWDNYWLISAWASGLPSLMPNYSLSRENPLQIEGQTHDHESRGKSWESSLGLVNIIPKIASEITNDDVQKLRVWGITRIYCWLFFPRLFLRKMNAYH